MSRPLPDQTAYAALQAKLEALLGPKGVIGDPETLAPYLLESRGLYRGSTPFMALPASREEVAATLRLAAEAGIAVVPQGGNTGRVSGALIRPEDGALLLNLKRLDKIRRVDPVDNAITVEAGCVLAEVQAAAAAAGRLFPLSLGAEGSCQIGGNLSSNAGGIHVLRYGNMRDLVLGLEVVLPNGEIWDGLSSLRKDNTGYDLKQLFIGAEGTLGIVTAATLKLFPQPRESISLFVALADLEAGLEVLSAAQAASGGALCACELIPGIALDMTLKHMPGAVDPLSARYDWHLLMEATSGRPDSGLKAALEEVLAEAFEQGRVPDAAVAASEGQAKAFWHLREALVEAQTREGASIKHDISVPVSKVPDFLRRAAAVAERIVPGIRPYPFGHLGDGNIHYNLSQPEGMDPADFMAKAPEIHAKVHDIAVGLGGSISAEHGIGRVKLAENRRFKSAVELDLMRRVKAAIDPLGLMNPGKLLDCD